MQKAIYQCFNCCNALFKYGTFFLQYEYSTRWSLMWYNETKMTKVKRIFAKNIQMRLDVLGWKVKDLAVKCEVTPGAIYGILQENTWVGPDMLEKIAEALQVPISVLFTDTERAQELTVTAKITADQALTTLAEALSKAKKSRPEHPSIADLVAKIPVDLNNGEIRLLFNTIDTIQISRAIDARAKFIKSKK